jgi:tetratricopeptide (TPR) repeat protein
MSLGLYHELMALVHLDLGDLAEAERCARASLQLATGCGEKYVTAWARVRMGQVLGKLAPSQFQEAERMILEGVRELQELKVKSECAKAHLYLADLYTDSGQREMALASLKKAHQMCQQMGMDYWLVRTEKALEKLKAR